MIKVASLTILVGLLALGVAPLALAQLTAAEQGPIVYGHHHLTVTNVEEHKHFWVDTLGGCTHSIRRGGKCESKL